MLITARECFEPLFSFFTQQKLYCLCICQRIPQMTRTILADCGNSNFLLAMDRIVRYMFGIKKGWHLSLRATAAAHIGRDGILSRRNHKPCPKIPLSIPNYFNPASTAPPLSTDPPTSDPPPGGDMGHCESQWDFSNIKPLAESQPQAIDSPCRPHNHMDARETLSPRFKHSNFGLDSSFEFRISRFRAAAKNPPSPPHPNADPEYPPPARS
jgi:hypothetical protein